jgi:hypothetical protein
MASNVGRISPNYSGSNSYEPPPAPVFGNLDLQDRVTRNGSLILVNKENITNRNPPQERGMADSAVIYSTTDKMPSTLPANRSTHRLTDSEITQGIRDYAQTIFIYLQHCGDVENKQEAFAAVDQLKTFGISMLAEDLEEYANQELLVFNGIEDDRYETEDHDVVNQDIFELELDLEGASQTEVSVVAPSNIQTEEQVTTPLKIRFRQPNHSAYEEQIKKFARDNSELNLKVEHYRNTRVENSAKVKLRPVYYCGTSQNSKAHGYGREYDVNGRIIFEGCYIFGRRLVDSDRMWVAILKMECIDENAALAAHKALRANFQGIGFSV